MISQLHTASTVAVITLPCGKDGHEQVSLLSDLTPEAVVAARSAGLEWVSRHTKLWAASGPNPVPLNRQQLCFIKNKEFVYAGQAFHVSPCPGQLGMEIWGKPYHTIWEVKNFRILEHPVPYSVFAEAVPKLSNSSAITVSWRREDAIPRQLAQLLAGECLITCEQRALHAVFSHFNKFICVACRLINIHRCGGIDVHGGSISRGGASKVWGIRRRSGSKYHK